MYPKLIFLKKCPYNSTFIKKLFFIKDWDVCEQLAKKKKTFVWNPAYIKLFFISFF